MSLHREIFTNFFEFIVLDAPFLPIVIDIGDICPDRVWI